MSSTENPIFKLGEGTEGIHPEGGSASTSVRCHVLLLKEDDCTYSAVVANLPGAGSCGDSEEHALENAKEAISGLIESYKAAGKPIPWCDSNSMDIPDGAMQKWIFVDA